MPGGDIDERRPLIEDRALRGGDLVLDPARLEEWLVDNLGGPCRVVPRRLRYKAGTSAVLGFDLTTDRGGVVTTQPCVASAFADDGAAKVEKARARLPPHVFLAHDGARHALVTTAAGDRALPLLPRLGQPDGLVRLVARLLPEDRDTAGTRTRTIRHNPGRRWVGTLERRGQPTLLLRAYDDSGALARAATGYAALARSRTPTPDMVARSRSLAVLAVTWVDGVDLGRTPDRPDRWRAAGRGLAGLHDGPRQGLRHPAPDAEVSAVHAAGRQITELVPEIADEVSEIVRVTSRELQHLSRGSLAIHGDFSPDQVVTGRDGVAAVIDLDAAQLGTAAYDLGCLLASTMVCAEATGSAVRGAEQMSAFLAGYDELRSPPDASAVALHAVAFRLRKAIDPFRECRTNWRQQVEQRVFAARAALDDVQAAGRGAW